MSQSATESECEQFQTLMKTVKEKTKEEVVKDTVVLSKPELCEYIALYGEYRGVHCNTRTHQSLYRKALCSSHMSQIRKRTLNGKYVQKHTTEKRMTLIRGKGIAQKYKEMNKFDEKTLVDLIRELNSVPRHIDVFGIVNEVVAHYCGNETPSEFALLLRAIDQPRLRTLYCETLIAATRPNK